MANPFFLFENIFADGDLTVTSEAAGYPKENLTDWRNWNVWRATATATQHIDVDYGSTIAPDTLVISGHNGATVAAKWRVAYSDTGTSYSLVDTYTAFVDDDPLVYTFSESAHRYWRVSLGVSPSDVVQAGIVMLGRRFELPRLDTGTAPYSQEVVSDAAINENGQMLGVNVKYVRRSGLNLNYDSMSLTEFWTPASGLTFDDDMAPHMSAGKPMWYAWNIDLEPRHVWYVYASKWDAPHVSTTNRRALRMRLEHMQ